MTTLVTGANGFVGTALCKALRMLGRPVRPVVRATQRHPADEVVIGDIGPETDWTPVLNEVDTVIHLAARAHVVEDTIANPLAVYLKVNKAGTARLAQQAAQAGVRRLIYVSSIKVLGEATQARPFHADDSPAPEDAYGKSKWEAEETLKAIARDTGIEAVIVRPPLVYGPGVKGNFARLVSLVKRGVPLPLGNVNNRRSLVALDNLVDLLVLCIDHPSAAAQTFLVSDGEDLSTPDLIRRIAEAMGRSARLMPIPVSMLKLAGQLTGRMAEVNRLMGSLQVDVQPTCRILGWSPRVTVDEGLRRAVYR